MNEDIWSRAILSPGFQDKTFKSRSIFRSYDLDPSLSSSTAAAATTAATTAAEA